MSQILDCFIDATAKNGLADLMQKSSWAPLCPPEKSHPSHQKRRAPPSMMAGPFALTAVPLIQPFLLAGATEM
ncbi:hypothetical protein, partial [Aeromonas sp. HMWF015]|uniref:hypothetical protein n=1 Tax=Aeromonas sp. HMWF015 TaxID=2056851 RepID=UPI001C6338F2